MRVSQLFNRTIKEDPADIEIVSHSLLIRSGVKVGVDLQVNSNFLGGLGYINIMWINTNK